MNRRIRKPFRVDSEGYRARLKITRTGWKTLPDGLSDVQPTVGPDIMRDHWGKMGSKTKGSGRLLNKLLLTKIASKVKAGWSLKRIAETLDIQPESLVWLLQQSNIRNIRPGRFDWSVGNDLTVHDFTQFRSDVGRQIPSFATEDERRALDAESAKAKRAETAKAEGRIVGKSGRPKISEEQIKAEIASGIRYPSGKLKPTSENLSSKSRVENN